MGGLKGYQSEKPLEKKEPVFDSIEEAVKYSEFLDKEAKLIKEIKRKKKTKLKKLKRF